MGNRQLTPLGKLIRQHAKELGIRDVDIARAVEISHPSLHDWLFKQGVRPRDRNLKKLSTALGIPIAEIHASLGRSVDVLSDDSKRQAVRNLVDQVPDDRLPEVQRYLSFLSREPSVQEIQ